MCCFLAALWACLAARAGYGVADVPNVHLQDSTRFVSNPAGVLSDSIVSALDARLRALMRQTTAEVVVVAIDEADTDDLDTYATKLFERWGIGKKDKDNGLLILISRDQRQAVLRTGQGMEGPLPDAICSRIIRQVMAPSFRQGDYDTGTLRAVNAVADIVSDPANADDIISSQRNNASNGSHDLRDDNLDLRSFFLSWLGIGLVLTVIMLIVWARTSRRTRGQSAHLRYDELGKLKPGFLAVGIAGLGVPLLAWLLVALQRRRLRLRPRLCPACHTRMSRLDEETDNKYLTAPQDTEERVGSVDYDVWLCPKCGETSVEPYMTSENRFQECPQCHTRAWHMTSNRVLRQPTQAREGVGEKVYRCEHCHTDTRVPYAIAKLPPTVVGPGFHSRGGGGFGGGFGGGSFGGGSTMGGGSRGGW